MPEYEQSIMIEASADEVFGFVANLSNLPKYLPTLHSAESAGQDRVRVQGAVGPHDYDAAGYFRVEPAEYFMEWCADTDRHYSGWLEVQEIDDVCEVTVHLSFNPDPVMAEKMARQSPSLDERMDTGMRSSLLSIKNLCESHSPHEYAL